MNALVIAPRPDDERVVTGLTLGERARRVAVRAGVPAERVHVVRDPDELRRAQPALAGQPLLLLRADGWVVAPPLVEPLRPLDPGTRIAVDASGGYAGAARADAREADALLAAVAADLAGGDRSFAGEAVTVGPRARHPARNPAEARAADAWQWDGIKKPMDAFLTVYVFRPLARPLTRLFLRSPLTPNMISVLSGVVSVAGCAIAAGPGYWAHVVGMLVLLAGGVLDCNDGEVARLRLEGSTLGGWIDAISDDLARLALLVGVGVHVAGRHPGWPVLPVTFLALALTLVTMLLIYWYCIVVIHSSNNQDYGAVLGLTPGVGQEKGQRSPLKALADFVSSMARRDFMDLAVTVLAILDLPEISFAALAGGSVIGLGVVLPTHLRIVRSRART